MDLHAGQIQGFFSKPVDHMTAMFMLTQYFRDLQLEDLVVVSPDAGRVKLAKKFAEKVGAELAILNKERPAQQVAEIGYVIGDVKGKTAVIVDDIIDTAGTLRAAAETVKDEGAARVFAAATHAVLSGNAFENLAAARVRADRRHGHDPAARRRAGQHHGPVRRRPADGLDPPDLHRRLGVRGLRRREPAVLSARAACRTLLGLTDEELLPCSTPTRSTVISGELDHRPELPILLDLLAEAEERAGAPVLRRWVRAEGPPGGRSTLLLARDFGALRGRARRRSPSAASCSARRLSRRPGPGASRPARRR